MPARLESMMRKSVVWAAILSMSYPVFTRGGPLDSHPTGGPWSRIAESARHEVTLAVLTRDMALTDEQARKLLDLLKRTERIVTGVAAGSAKPAAAFRTSMAGYRDRVLATATGYPNLQREEIKARQAWDENVGQFDREIQPIRDEAAGLLSPAQQKVLREFSPDRTLTLLGFDDEDLDEWAQRLIAMRAVPEKELEDRVKEELADQLHESGHPERLPKLIQAIKDIRAQPAEKFDADVIAHAKKIKRMLSVQAEAKPPPPEVMELPDAVDTHLLDMRMIPVLEAYLARPAAKKASK